MSSQYKLGIVLLELSPLLGAKNVKIVRLNKSSGSFETIYEIDSASLTGVISCTAQVSKIASHP